MSVTHSDCLNCGHTLHGKFCSNCGQKADTHRITLKHFITHDLIHGVWHVDKGLFFTMKESLIRAGKAANEYIEGKRIKYYNVFYLSLLLLGLNLLLLHYFVPTSELDFHSEGGMTAIAEFIKDNIKIIILSFIPVISFTAWIIFKKCKLNIAEHFIIAGFLFCGMILLSIFQNILDAIPSPFSKILDYSLIPLIDGLQIIFPGYIYYQALSKNYSKTGFFIRLLLFYLLTLFIYIIIIVFTLLLFNYFHTGNLELEGTLELK